jgi:hypothetical protein
VKNVNPSVNGHKPIVSNTLPTYWKSKYNYITHANFMLIGRNIFLITKKIKLPTIQNSVKSCLFRKVEKYEIKFTMSLQWVMKFCSYPPKCSLQIRFFSLLQQRNTESFVKLQNVCILNVIKL